MKTKAKKPRWMLIVSLLAVFAVLAAACGDDDDDNDASSTGTASTAATGSEAEDEPDPDSSDDSGGETASDSGGASASDSGAGSSADSESEPMPPGAPVTQGPGGEVAVPAGEIVLSDAQVAEVRAGGHSAALLWHTSGAFVDAVSRGARDAFGELGVEVVAETNAGFDAAQQANDVETVMAQSPDAIISLAIGPDAGAEAFRPAVDAGVQLVFLSNVPQGYVHGEDYVSIVTDDLAAMGITAADLLADAIGGSGEVGYIFHDAAYYVTNQRDQAFKSWIEINYPDIEIVAEQGLADPAAAEEIASAMLTRNPGLDGIYAPWAAGPADGVLAALRAAGASDVALVTMDLDTNVSLDMVEGGNVAGIAADEAYNLGRTMAVAAAHGLLGLPAPAFAVVPAVGVTADNIVEGYQQSLATTPPQEVLDALGG
ncbi:MAG: substrate-binding domain-containing protein [Acidimicrobiaceae bacterium]|nr:substrate-binding domain-containing protein [Acidimicrobiaceae bacterium]MCY4279651.1 substrate-binding domain-containing protein [Acidimicrobiaceae bacterium]MCY4293335.1 substrate-binding domain-containing protein [Acidimicrobiaceae bacterium]